MNRGYIFFAEGIKLSNGLWSISLQDSSIIQWLNNRDFLGYLFSLDVVNTRCLFPKKSYFVNGIIEICLYNLLSSKLNTFNLQAFDYPISIGSFEILVKTNKVVFTFDSIEHGKSGIASFNIESHIITIWEEFYNLAPQKLQTFIVGENEIIYFYSNLQNRNYLVDSKTKDCVDKVEMIDVLQNTVQCPGKYKKFPNIQVMYPITLQFSNDGKKLVYLKETSKYNKIILVDVLSGEQKIIDQFKKHKFINNIPSAFAWSPDNEWVTYCCNRKNDTFLRIKNVVSDKTIDLLNCLPFSKLKWVTLPERLILNMQNFAQLSSDGVF